MADVTSTEARALYGPRLRRDSIPDGVTEYPTRRDLGAGDPWQHDCALPIHRFRPPLMTVGLEPHTMKEARSLEQGS